MYIHYSTFPPVFLGITQEMIDDTRLLTEKGMLGDMKSIFKEQGNFDFQDKHGASPVYRFD